MTPHPFGAAFFVGACAPCGQLAERQSQNPHLIERPRMGRVKGQAA